MTSELENTDPENELTIQNVYLQIVIEPKYLIILWFVSPQKNSKRWELVILAQYKSDKD